MLALAWEQIGRAIERYADEPAGPAVGRVIQYQSAYAANHLHPKLRRVPIYRRLDEASGGMLDELGPILATPILAAMMATNPDLRDSPVLQRMFAGQIKLLAVDAAKEAKATQKAIKEAEEFSAEAAMIAQGWMMLLFEPRPADEQGADDQSADWGAAAPDGAPWPAAGPSAG